jgi:hypothetical protein
MTASARSYTRSMPCPTDAPYARWLVTRTENPPGQTLIEPRRRATVRGELYNGTVTKLPVWAVARARGWVLVEQRVEVEETWLAWVPAQDVTPISQHG